MPPSSPPMAPIVPGSNLIRFAPMLALTYDRKKDPWETTKGLRQQEVPAPVLDE